MKKFTKTMLKRMDTLRSEESFEARKARLSHNFVIPEPI